MKIVLFALTYFFLSLGLTETRKALVYDIGKTKEPARFTQDTEINEIGPNEKSWSAKIKDVAGTLLMTEKATLKNGKTVFQYIEQLQVGEAYELKVEGNKATFKTYKIVDGKVGVPFETKSYVIDDQFATGPMTETSVSGSWSQLTEGKALKIEFGVFELLKIVSFEFKKVKEDTKVLQLEMKPSSFFISMLVEPILIEFDKVNKRMVRYVGRTPLQQKVDGRWKAIDAEIIYPL